MKACLSSKLWTVPILIGFLVVLPAWVSAAPSSDSDGDGLNDEEEKALGTSRGDPDTDDDGLLDGWEVNGYWEGASHELLPGANPLFPDVFVEVDWMFSSGESAQVNAQIAYEAAVDVVRAFRRANRQVTIHFDLGPNIKSFIPRDHADILRNDVVLSEFTDKPDEEKLLPYQDRFPARPDYTHSSTACSPESTLLSLYDAYYGGRYFRASRRNIFYYVVFAEQSEPPQSNDDPQAERNHPYVDGFDDEWAKRDGLLSAGCKAGVIFRKPVPTLSPVLLRYHYSVSLLHELGHAFGLGHGGTASSTRWDNTNYKPNYPSIMNYRYQDCGVAQSAGLPLMDFSHGRMRSLRETALYEPTGMGVLPNEHILECVGVARLASSQYTDNLDWNNDGVISKDLLAYDVNYDGAASEEVFSDHDDWGKLIRDGFDGIGNNAFKRCGLDCGRGGHISRLVGDFDGDHRQDCLLQRAGVMAWLTTNENGVLRLESSRTPVESIGGWRPSSRDSLLAGDFLGTGRDLVLAHRDQAAALIDYNFGRPRLAWYVDKEIAGAPGGKSPSWRLGSFDRFLGLPFSRIDATDLLVTNGHDVKLFMLGGPEQAAQGVWSSGAALFEWTRGESPSCRVGRCLADGRRTLFLLSASAWLEVAPPIAAEEYPTFTHLDREGVVPSLDPAESGWVLSSTDRLQPVDLDGAGEDEVIFQNVQRLAVAQWDEDGVPRIVWQTRDHLEGIANWPLSKQPGSDRLHVGQFAAGGGKEVLVSNGRSWALLGWDRAESALKVAAVHDAWLLDGPRAWPLAPHQAVHMGRFLPTDQEAIIVQDREGLLLVSLTSEGLHWEARAEGRVGDWILQGDDELLPANLDADPELELLARNGDRFGVLELYPAPASLSIEEVDLETLTFRRVSQFKRGDANGDGTVDISDVVRILGYSYLGFGPLDCQDAADANDQGVIDVSDPIFILNFLFSGDRVPPPPGPFRAGLDPTQDNLGCDR